MSSSLTFDSYLRSRAAAPSRTVLSRDGSYIIRRGGAAFIIGLLTGSEDIMAIREKRVFEARALSIDEPASALIERLQYQDLYQIFERSALSKCGSNGRTLARERAVMRGAFNQPISVNKILVFRCSRSLQRALNFGIIKTSPDKVMVSLNDSTSDELQPFFHEAWADFLGERVGERAPSPFSEKVRDVSVSLDSYSFYFSSNCYQFHSPTDGFMIGAADRSEYLKDSDFAEDVENLVREGNSAPSVLVGQPTGEDEGLPSSNSSSSSSSSSSSNTSVLSGVTSHLLNRQSFGALEFVMSEPSQLGYKRPNEAVIEEFKVLMTDPQSSIKYITKGDLESFAIYVYNGDYMRNYASERDIGRFAANEIKAMTATMSEIQKAALKLAVITYVKRLDVMTVAEKSNLGIRNYFIDKCAKHNIMDFSAVQHLISKGMAYLLSFLHPDANSAIHGAYREVITVIKKREEDEFQSLLLSAKERDCIKKDCGMK